MDTYEATRIVISRIQSLEAENVSSKIIGYFLLQDMGDEGIIRLAFGPNTLLRSMISKAKRELGLSASALSSPYASDCSPLQYSQFSHVSSRALPSPAAYSSSGLYWGSPVDMTTLLAQDVLHPGNLPAPEDHNIHLKLSHPPSSELIQANDKFPTYHDQFCLRDEVQDQLSYVDSAEHLTSYSLPNDSVYQEMFTLMDGTNGGSNHRRSSSLADASVISESVSWKPCLYFARGYCKHGYNCRFFHGNPRSSENLLSLSSSTSPKESRNEDGGSLECLEIEMLELLRGKRAPISIASLPQLYYDRFGKTLQAEGYLTESQRHGKAGYSLTNLLARLKNTVTLIDRPHGQHAVVLTEDAHKFMAYRNGRDDLGGVNPGSRQIYMTFPAESTFTEEDVSNYFRIYGPVQDVRIPYQQKRMFGFVTYVFPETVKIILAKGNPHYVCGSRVLVKPYREKSKHGDRKYGERVEHLRYMPAYNTVSKEYDLHPVSRLLDSSEMMRRQLEEQEQVVEVERLRFAELHLFDAHRRQMENQVSMVTAHQNHFSSNGLLHDEEDPKFSEDLTNFEASTDRFGYLLEVLDSEQIDESESKEKVNNDGECNGHNLPDSPFAIPPESNGVKTFSLPEKMKDLAISTKSSAQGADLSKELTCSMSLDSVVDLVQLEECTHATNVFKGRSPCEKTSVPFAGSIW